MPVESSLAADAATALAEVTCLGVQCEPGPSRGSCAMPSSTLARKASPVGMPRGVEVVTGLAGRAVKHPEGARVGARQGTGG